MTAGVPQNLRDYSARTHRVVLDMIMIMTFYHYTQSNKLFVCVPEEGLDNTQQRTEEGGVEGH